jgi:hypothetical protein
VNKELRPFRLCLISTQNRTSPVLGLHMDGFRVNQLQRRMAVWDSGFHGAKVLTMRFQSAVWPTATDMKDAITIPA